MRSRPGTGIQLTHDQQQRLDSALRDIADLLPDIDKAKACGVDCQEHADMAAYLQQRLNRIKQEFGQLPTT